MGQVLSCDTGTGKTIMSLAIARSFGKMAKVLVIVPKIVTDNWKVEYGKFLEPLYGPGCLTNEDGNPLRKVQQKFRKLNAFKRAPAGHFLLSHS